MSLHQRLKVENKHHGSAPIRVMLIDDSNVVRSIFSRLLTDSGQIEIVAEAGNSAEAIEQLQSIKADIILLDIEMPDRTGLDALPDILEAAGGGRVMVVSSFVEENGPAAIKALSLGACDTLSKPGRTGFAGRFPELLIDKVVRLGRSARPAGSNSNGFGAAVVHPAHIDASKPECIAIGASTGGIPVIHEIVRSLPAALDCPIFITQHLPDAFMEFFAKQLQSQTHRKVLVPKSGAEVEPYSIYISPGDKHLVCRRAGSQVYIEHLTTYAASRYSPSVDALFESIAASYGESGMAIVLSGMGNDGALGAQRLAACRARIIVQDEETSVVWGMPGAVARSGLASAIMSPDHLVRFLDKAACS